MSALRDAAALLLALRDRSPSIRRNWPPDLPADPINDLDDRDRMVLCNFAARILESRTFDFDDDPPPGEANLRIRIDPQMPRKQALAMIEETLDLLELCPPEAEPGTTLKDLGGKPDTALEHLRSYAQREALRERGISIRKAWENRIINKDRAQFSREADHGAEILTHFEQTFAGWRQFHSASDCRPPERPEVIQSPANI